MRVQARIEAEQALYIVRNRDQLISRAFFERFDRNHHDFYIVFEYLAIFRMYTKLEEYSV